MDACVRTNPRFGFDQVGETNDHWRQSPRPEVCPRMGSLIKKRRKKMSKHKYRKRLKANRHKKK